MVVVRISGLLIVGLSLLVTVLPLRCVLSSFIFLGILILITAVHVLASCLVFYRVLHLQRSYLSLLALTALVALPC